MPEGDRYINVPATQLLAELRAIGEAIRSRGGKVTEGTSGQEVVFDFTPPNRQVFVRIYTSLAVGRITVRDCGQDAIRIVVGSTATASGHFWKFSEPRRIYRTAPKGEREERVAAFLERLKVAIREAYKTALQVPTCPQCGAPMRERESKAGQKFYGCAKYPHCKGTRPTNGAPCENRC
jgi:hypothetical protein